MSLKFRIIFYNVMLFLVIFDVIYLLVWIFSIEMNPVKAVMVAGITSVLMPWARSANGQSKRKVVIRSLAYQWYRKYQENRINS